MSAVVDTDVADVFRAMRDHVGAGRATLAELAGGQVEVESQGTRVRDAHGREFLDCGGYGVFIHGHRHPHVVAAVHEQLDRHPLATRLLGEPRLCSAARALARVTPPGLDLVHFATSGAEATEIALKLARMHGKRRLVATVGGYHGKTMGALSVTGRSMYQQPFRPLLPGVAHVPFGDAEALWRELAECDGDCCVIVEPVQGEGGVIVPPDGYLSEVERACRESGAFFVLDEVQTGLGRLGDWWGADREDVRPDVLLVGKGLSGGVVPVAAAVATAEAYAPLAAEPLLHTSTFAGAPLAMAAAEAAIEAIEQDGLVERARDVGATLLADLRERLAPGPGRPVTDVRGRGLLIGIEMAAEHLAGDLTIELLERGVIVNHSLNAHAVLRLTPPALLSAAEVDWVVDACAAGVDELERRYPNNDGRWC